MLNITYFHSLIQNVCQRLRSHHKYDITKHNAILYFILYHIIVLHISLLQNTKVERIHKPCGFAYKIVTKYESYDKPVQVYQGTDAADRFILCMHEEYEAASKLLFANKEMTPLTHGQKQVHNAASMCYLCEKDLSSNDKVHDHCHYR